MGIHVLCDHGELPDGYPVLKCKGQISFLAKVLLALHNKVDLLLGINGSASVNIVEAFNSVLAKFRAKRLKWLVEANVLASNMAIIFWQQMHLSFWLGEEWDYLSEVAEVIQNQCDLPLKFSSGELKVMFQNLRERVSDKERWMDPANKVKKAAQRTKKRAGSDKPSAYLSRRTDEGLDEDVRPTGALAAFYQGDVTAAEAAFVDQAVTAADLEASADDRAGPAVDDVT